MNHRKVIITLLVAAGLLVGGAVMYATSTTSSYDDDGSGYIDNYEATQALRDYLDGNLSQAEAIDVLFYYWMAEPVLVATPTPTPIRRPVVRAHIHTSHLHLYQYPRRRQELSSRLSSAMTK